MRSRSEIDLSVADAFARRDAIARSHALLTALRDALKAGEFTAASAVGKLDAVRRAEIRMSATWRVPTREPVRPRPRVDAVEPWVRL
jgi:hypothetical protein